MWDCHTEEAQSEVIKGLSAVCASVAQSLVSKLLSACSFYVVHYGLSLETNSVKVNKYSAVGYILIKRETI